jgi:hypothetical protein
MTVPLFPVPLFPHSRYLYIYVPVFSGNLIKVEFGAVQIEFKLIGIFKEGDKY